MIPFAKESLAPVSRERLKQIVSRLLLHFRCPEGEKQHRLFGRYSTALQHYPEDLLCAAYHHTLCHHTGELPKIDDFISFMEPEMNHRRSLVRQNKVEV
ncbi:MAG: hypothetical protein KGI29_08595 [Pseudomonadota bacterium]|nr:hypothetical protein [Pseudomonadota bacterium]MDE3037812.1 hypothetical protein [Pseudomonadota bacterium]